MKVNQTKLRADIVRTVLAHAPEANNEQVAEIISKSALQIAARPVCVAGVKAADKRR